MSFDYRKYFPYPKPREIQSQALETLASNWDAYDVFIISAPTAFGKTALARTLINARHGVSVITPTNLLVEQFREEFPDTPTLSRLDSYWCKKWDRPASVTRGKTGAFCRKIDNCPGCRQAATDLSTAKYQRGPGIYNYHTYLAHKLYRPALVIDEAHNLIPVIRDRLALRLWQHDYKYPSNMYSAEQIRSWLETVPPHKRNGKKLELLAEAVQSSAPRYTAERAMEEFNGKGTERGRPEPRDCIRLLPVDISDAPPMFWPSEVEKLILMSATIGPKDVESLGLEGKGRRKRVLYIDCASPIPRGVRPILPLNLFSVNRNSLAGIVPEMARTIDGLSMNHIGEKGIIHATYQLAGYLRAHLQGDRYLFHTRENKRAIYQQFRESNPSEGRILVASGMYEGIDLPEDLGRWQVISKIPWPSLGSPAIQYLADRDPDWYLWEAIKTTIQACGRICRTPTDYGRSYILDSSFQRILREGGYMLPSWFTDALIEGDK